MTRLSYSDDYAVLESGSKMFYYGYEYADELGLPEKDDQEWGFFVREGNEVVRSMPYSALEKGQRDADEYSVLENLLIGIGKYLEYITHLTSS